MPTTGPVSYTHLGRWLLRYAKTQKFSVKHSQKWIKIELFDYHAALAPNRINRRFNTSVPHQKITTDTSEFNLPGEAVVDFKRSLKLNENILRFMFMEEAKKAQTVYRNGKVIESAVLFTFFESGWDGNGAVSLDARCSKQVQ